MTNMPTNMSEITPQFLTAILRQSNMLKKAEIVSFTLDKAVATGFFGIVSRLHLQYDHDEDKAPKTLVVKIPCENVEMENLGKAVGFYSSEHGFYEDIAPHATIPVPRCYYNYLSPSTCMIIMEDLAPMRNGDQRKGATLVEINSIVERLAKFHAAWWNSPKLNDYPWLQDAFTGTGMIIFQGAYKNSIASFCDKCSSFLSEEQKYIAAQWFEPAAISAIYGPLQRQPQTIAHGDARLDNFLFGASESNPEVTFIDFQLMVKGPGIIDLSYLLSQSTTIEFRRANEDAIIRNYHKTLVDLGVKDYSWDDCWDGYRRGVFRYFFPAVMATVMAFNEQTKNLARVFAERGFAAASDLKIGELCGGAGSGT